jgi:hypothetical protein
MDLVLVTGAGASHNLGPADEPLPLMHEWADALCSGLDAAEDGLAKRCRLTPGMGSERFEQALGELLRWEAVKQLNGAFANMTDAPGQFQELDAQASARLGVVRRVINDTLYANFGQERVDPARATKAYESLLDRLQVGRLVLATTNYDRSCEAALAKLGRRPHAGFRAEDSESLERLEVTNLVATAREENRTACLHLHGAVGWYLSNGIVYDFKGRHGFNETLGSPVVLYPDPEKDPTSDAHVAALWEEFRTALGETDYVLVLGHSLNDPALIKELRTARFEKLAVTFFTGNGPDDEAKQNEWIEKNLPGAIQIGLDFGPNLKTQSAGIDKFSR